MSGHRHTIFRRILVGYDGSEQSEKAADLAISMSKSLDATLLIFSVARPPEPATRVEVDAVLDDAKEHFEHGFKRIVMAAKDAGVEVATEVEVGHPAEHIIHRAETGKFDLVVLGRRGTSTFQKWILGSISERVLRYAHCPVLVIK